MNIASPIGTAQKKHNLAINDLENKAILAHENGDGFLVNHLCSVAMVNVNKWINENKYTINLSDISWAVILSLYWFIDDFMFFEIKRIIKNASTKDYNEEKIKTSLLALILLAQESLGDCESEIKNFTNSDISWIEKVSPKEGMAFLKICTELAFIRRPEGDLWLYLIENLISKTKNFSCDFYSKELELLKDRLIVQSKLIYSNTAQPITQLDIDKINNREKDMANLWKTWLNCEWEEFDHIIDDILAKKSWKDQDAIAIYDLQHWAHSSRKQESQYIGLTRRKLQVSGQKGNINNLFNEFRNASFYRKSVNLQQNKTNGNDNLRFDCFRIAMFTEIAALRDWNLANWKIAILQKIQASQELLRQMENDNPNYIDYAISVFTNLLLIGNMNDKNPFHQDIIKAIDFAGEEDRIEMCKKIINIPPRYWYGVISALHLLSDSIPEPVLISITEWCINYDNSPLEFRKDWRLDWWTFWGDIFETLPESHSVFHRIFPLFQKMAKNILMWKDDKRYALLRFILHAPLDMALSIVENMNSIKIEKFDPFYEKRWWIIYQASRIRNEIKENFIQNLHETTTNSIQKLYIQMINEPLNKIVPQDDHVFKENIMRSILCQSDDILENECTHKGFNYHISPDYIRYVSWAPNEIDSVINPIIESLESPKISINQKIRFIYYLNNFISANNGKCIDLICPCFEKLITNCSKISSKQLKTTDPLSGVQINLENENDVIKSLLNLSVTICRYAPDSSAPLIINWVKTNLHRFSEETYPIILNLCVVLGINGEYLSESEMLSITLIIIQKSMLSPDSTNDRQSFLIDIIDQISYFTDSNNSDSYLSFLNTDKSDRKSNFLKNLEGFLPEWIVSKDFNP